MAQQDRLPQRGEGAAKARAAPTAGSVLASHLATPGEAPSHFFFKKINEFTCLVFIYIQGSLCKNDFRSRIQGFIPYT